MSNQPKTLKLTGAALKAACTINVLHRRLKKDLDEAEENFQSTVLHLKETLGATINQRFVELFEFLGVPAHEMNNYILDTSYLEAHGDVFLKRVEPEAAAVPLEDLLNAAKSTKP